MTGQLRSALIAGLISAVIWMVIATAVGFSAGAVIGWGLGLLVFTFAVTLLVSTLIGRSRASSGRR